VANGGRTGKTAGPTTSFQLVSKREARQTPTDLHRSPQIPVLYGSTAGVVRLVEGITLRWLPRGKGE